MRTLWQFDLMGGLRACRGSHDVTQQITRKPGSLLAYLCLRPGRAVPRDVLAERFWPETELDQARQNLRAALKALRKVLATPDLPAEHVLLAGRTDVQMAAEWIATDVRAYRAALERANAAISPSAEQRLLLTAVDMYRGPLLDGWGDEWIESEREQLSQLCGDALRRLYHLAWEAGETGSAARSALKLAEVRGEDEEAILEAMGLLVRAGDPAAALRTGHRYAETLKRKYELQPGSEFRGLMRRLAAGDFSGAERDHSIRSVAPRWEVPAERNDPPGSGHAFFGREPELARLVRFFKTDAQHGAPRLFTLTGPAGSGKSRLALETGRRLAPQYQEEVWHVPLEGTPDVSLLVPAILAALRLHDLGARHPVQLLAQRLRRHPALLVLDNFEHLGAPGAAVVAELLERLPRLRLLVTSRCRIGVEEERHLELPPLPLPTEGAPLDEAVRTPAVALFLDRARWARPGFGDTPDEVSRVVTLCQRLEGLPLALELAAAWAPILSPDQMLAQLEQRFLFLKRKSPTGSGRHPSLEAALEWSWDRLSPGATRTLAYLSVFRSGFTAELAAAVCGSPETLEYLEELRSHSMLLAAPEEDGMRLRLLESVREFGAQRLPVADRTEIARRHGECFIIQAEVTAASLDTDGAQPAFQRLSRDYDNFGAALEWASSQPAWEPAFRLCRALGRYWIRRGLFEEGRRWLLAVVERADLPLARGAELLQSLGSLARTQADYLEARDYFQRGHDLAEVAGETEGILDACVGLASVDHFLGNFSAALERYARCREVSVSTGDRLRQARALCGMGLAVRQLGDAEQARRLLKESLDRYREVGNLPGLAVTYCNLGVAMEHQGDYPAALAYHRKHFELVRRLGNRRGLASALHNLANTSLRLDHLRAAGDYLREALTMLREIGERHVAVECLESRADLLIAEGDLSAAVVLTAAAAEFRDTYGFPRPNCSQENYQHHLSRLREPLSPTEFQTAWERGRLLDWEEAIAFALGERDMG